MEEGKFSRWVMEGDASDVYSSMDFKVEESIHSVDVGWEDREDGRLIDDETVACRARGISDEEVRHMGHWIKLLVKMCRQCTRTLKVCVRVAWKRDGGNK